MKTSKPTVVVFLIMAVSTFSTVVAQEQDEDTYLNPNQAPASSSTPAVTLDVVDQHLLEASQAIDESARGAALRAAQVALDTMYLRSDTAPNTSSVPGENAEWLAQTERSLGRFQEQTRKELRESLMQKLWASPYGAIPAHDLTALETVSDVLRLVREIQRLGGGGTDVLEVLQTTYWNRLMSHRESAGLEYTALGDMKKAPVFDQQVLRGKDGEIHLYQLTGMEDHTLRWVQAPVTNVPTGLLTSEALTVDLSRESASWLLVMDGEGLANHLVAHRHWLEVIEREVRLVLLERGDYAVALRDLPPEWFSPGRRVPYVLPAVANKTPAQLYLVRVADKRVLGSWPLINLDGPGGPALKDLINRIFAATNPQ